MTGFQHAIAGGQGNLVIAALQSPNFVHLLTGWQIAKDGSAEFNNLTFRGTFMGADFEINSAGAFFYSGIPAAGNLINSITSSAGTDGFGNAYESGVTTYVTLAGNEYALQIGAVTIGGQPTLGFYGQQLTTPPFAPAAFTPAATGSVLGSFAEMYSGLTNSGATASGVECQDSVLSGDPNGVVIISGDAYVTGALTVNGSGDTSGPSPDSSSSVGLPNGTITGTSGGASAGTAHTHGAGSYSVTDGVHSHTLDAHTHPL